MEPIFTVNAAVLGIRPTRTDDQGAVTQFTVDLYTESGPLSLTTKPDDRRPDVGSKVEAQVQPYAYSGFAKKTRSGDAVSGDATIYYRLISYYVPGAPAASANGKPKVEQPA